MLQARNPAEENKVSRHISPNVNKMKVSGTGSEVIIQEGCDENEVPEQDNTNLDRMKDISRSRYR